MSVGQGGGAIFNISDGGRLLFDTGTIVAVGLSSGSNGRLTADGNGSLIDATGALVSVGKFSGSAGTLVLTNQASLLLAQDTFIGDGGNGNLSVSSGSHVTLSGALTKLGVGNEAGSAGSISVQGTDSSLTVAGPMIVGFSGDGFLGAGQEAQIVLNNPLGLKVGEVAKATGRVVLDGERTSLVTKYLAVGDDGVGQVTISNGAELDANGPRVDVGTGDSAVGSILVTGTNSLLSVMTNFPMTVGGNGKGSLSLAAGAQFYSAVGIAIAVKNGSTGAISVSDAGTLFDAPSLAFGDLPIPGFPTDGGAGTITVQNSGQLRARNSLSIRASTANPSVIINNGQIAVGTGNYGPAGSLRVSENGFLSGNAKTIQGQVIVGLGGRISPGNSPGVFAIDGSYEQDAGSTYSAEIGGTDPGGYDQISVTGAATLGGTLSVHLVNGFTPAVGQTYRLVNAASLSGAFTSIVEPSQAGISVTSDATGLIVTITSVVAGAPVISSATTVNAAPGAPFSYQIAATNSPTSFGATNLPAGLTVDHNTGLISGTPTTTGAFIVPINANNAAGSGQADLMIIIDPTFGSAALPPSNLVNISTRLNVQTGDNVLIGGFIITGTDPKKVLIRAIGPSLPLAGVLANPTLELYQGTTLLEANDNWMDSPNKQAIIDSTIPPTNPLESAIVRSVPPGNYTAIERGVNNGTGIGVVEAYDLDTSANSKLANISTRGLVQTGDNVLFAGTIIVGQASQKVIIRALGPSTGVPGAMADPTLELHDGNGALLEANDNWVDSPNKQAIIDSTIPPPNNAESAIVRTLTPANYTAIVRGVNNSTGIAVVEVYALN